MKRGWQEMQQYDSVAKTINKIKERGVEVVSFDFDWTLTNKHTWNELGYSEEDQKVTQESLEIQSWFPDFEFTKRLINGIIRDRDLQVVITTKQHKTIVEQIVVKSGLLEDKNEIEIISTTNKADKLSQKFKDKKLIHFDDDGKEVSSIKNKGFEAIKVDERGGIAPEKINKILESLESLNFVSSDTRNYNKKTKVSKLNFDDSLNFDDKKFDDKESDLGFFPIIYSPRSSPSSPKNITQNPQVEKD